MINQAIKIDSMHNIFIFLMQYCVHGTTVNECPKFLSASPAKNNHALLVHDPNSCSPSLTIPLSLDGVTSYFKAQCPSLAEYKDKKYPSITSHPQVPCGTPVLPCTPPKRTAWLTTGDA